MTTKKETPVEKLLRVSGGAPAIARKLKISRQFVLVCVGRGWFPAPRAKQLEAFYGVPRRGLMNPELLDLLN
jgi:hypothetical protein